MNNNRQLLRTILKVSRRWECGDKGAFIGFLKEYRPHVELKQSIYTVKWKEVVKFKHLRAICRKYDNSHIIALIKLFPELQLRPWGFSNVPKHYWRNKANQREFFDWFKEKQGIENPEDWKRSQITKLILKEGGTFLKSEYNNSLLNALQTIYPHEPWNLYFTSSMFWKDPANIRLRLESISDELQISDRSQWLLVTTKQLAERGFSHAMNIHGGKDKMLMAAYPTLIPLLNDKLQQQVNWEDVKEVKRFIEKLQREKKIEKQEDWYGVTRKDVIKHGGSGLLQKYGGLINVLSIIYPKDEWGPRANAPRFPQGYWNDVANVRSFMESIRIKYHITENQDWYDVISYQTLLKEGALTGLSLHGGIVGLLRTAYPEQQWPDIAKPKQYWKNSENIIKLIRHIEEELAIEKPEDWYRMSNRLVANFGGGTPLRNFGLTKMLKIAYPNVLWDNDLLLRRNKKACQFYLRKQVEALFPNCEIVEDYRHNEIRFEGTTAKGELDIYLPSLQLAFEYNGEQHYHDYPAFGPVELYKQRDAEKAKICKQIGITLVVVPYWWDEQRSSLIQLIGEVNSELLFHINKEHVIP